MPDGAAVAAAAMAAEMQKIGLISHNLANALTPGYKRSWPVSNSFAGLLALASASDDAPPVASSSWDQAIDFRPAPLRQTGNALDLAIEGKGFFEIRDGQQQYYTRQGSFVLDASGRLTTPSGAVVAGLGGDILLDSAQVRIDRLGRVYDKDQQVAQLKLLAFDDTSKLRPVGAGLYTVGDAQARASDESVVVRQGYLEASNVVASDEMVRLIEAMRRFEGGQKVIQWYDDMLEKALTRLGEF